MIIGWLYVSPLMLVLIPFFVAPILVVLAASFFQSDGFGGLIADPTLQNYADIFSSGLTAQSLRRDDQVHRIDLVLLPVIGFWVAYFLVFHVRNPLLAIGLFLLCTVPFWTSNIIRMISWIPLLGKEGLINMRCCGSASSTSRSNSCCFPVSRSWSPMSTSSRSS